MGNMRAMLAIMGKEEEVKVRTTAFLDSDTRLAWANLRRALCGDSRCY
jgi:hypothetical protein